MQSKLLKKHVATVPVVNKPGGQMAYEKALADLSGGVPYEEAVAALFCTEVEEDAAIEAMLEDDPEGEKDIPYEQAKAELDGQLEALVAAAKRRLRNQ